MKSDLLKFNQVELENMIRVISEIRDTIKNLDSSYNEYIVNELEPIWTTTGGLEAVRRLKNFSATEIADFIKDLTRRIDDLQVALKQVGIIDKA